MRRMDRTIKAFTLLELICVIAIIFFLVALLMPALSRVKKISTRVICGSNMKGFGTVCAIYLNDFADTFPDPKKWLYSDAAYSPEHPIGCRWHDLVMAPTGETMTENKAFQGQMWQYLADSKYPICPDFREIAYKRGCENPGHLESIDVIPQYNYSMNSYLGYQGEGGVLKASEIGGSNDKSSSFVSSVSSSISYEKYKPTGPAAIFFFAEENCWSVRPDHPKYPARWLNAPLSTKALDDTSLLITPTPNAQNCFATFHGESSNDDGEGFGNAVFVDGHVDMITARQQLRKTMHAGSFEGRSSWERNENKSSDPAGNLRYAWASPSPPPGGWENQ